MASILVTPSKLLSETIITYLKIWHGLEKIFTDEGTEKIMELIHVHSALWSTLEIAYDQNNTDEIIGKAKRKICQLNTRRTILENELDENFENWFRGEDMYPLSPVLKDYEKKNSD